MKFRGHSQYNFLMCDIQLAFTAKTAAAAAAAAAAVVVVGAGTRASMIAPASGIR